MRKLTVLILFLLSLQLSAQIDFEGSSVDTHTVVTGLDIPWELQWGPEGWIWYTERYGKVSRVHPETSEVEELLDLTTSVHQQGESGLLGMALHPDFPTDNRVYLVYTYLDGSIKERLVSFQYSNGVLSNESILIDAIPGNTTHDGSRLVFGPDGMLYMTTGDAQNLSAPQTRSSINGKVLRITEDGGIPNDNPYGTYVWSVGHRNAQGLYFHGDVLYSSEHGPNTDDEINIISEAGNYGWEPVRGFCNLPAEQQFCADSNVIEPLKAWTPTIATSDIVVYESDAIPGLEGKMILTTLKEQDMRVLTLSEDGTEITDEVIYFDQWWGRLRDVLVSPDGRIYIATNGFTWGESGTFRHHIIEIKHPQVHGFSDPGKGPQPKVYPNPTKDRLRFDFEGLAYKSAKVQIVSVTGQTVLEKDVTSGEAIDLRLVEPGMYLYRILSPDGHVGKLMIQ